MSNLESVLTYWFPTENYQPFWFDKRPDNYIRQIYSTTLSDEETGKFDHLKDDTSMLARIILLDQFTRNLNRESNEAAHANDAKALTLSLELLNSHRDLNFPVNQRIFILMPLRHTMKEEWLRFVLLKIKEYLLSDVNESQQTLLRIFKEHTLRSLIPLESNIVMHYPGASHKLNMKDYDAILDADCKLYNNVTIGESPESVALTNTIRNYVLGRAFKNICVSLSGGVDSMAMLHILKRLVTEGVLEKIMAVHIEYINRDEAELETAMLLEWCGMESIPLVVRKIDYMSRDEVSREFYEEQTRKARFGAYRYMMREYGMQGFCLGHHYGDLGENVLMNLFVGRDILDLFVMEEDSEIDGVRLLRPMLKHPKVDIFQYARDHKIPYFIDTTPDWCCRGVLRRKIMPILEDQYSGIHGTLARIGERSREWNQMIETMIIQPFLKKVVREKDRMSFEVDAILLEQPRVFWFRIFLEIFHSVGRKMISGKNMDSLLSLFRRRLDSKEKFGLQFSNGLTGEFKHNRIVIMI